MKRGGRANRLIQIPNGRFYMALWRNGCGRASPPPKAKGPSPAEQPQTEPSSGQQKPDRQTIRRSSFSELLDRRDEQSLSPQVAEKFVAIRKHSFVRYTILLSNPACGFVGTELEGESKQLRARLI